MAPAPEPSGRGSKLWPRIQRNAVQLLGLDLRVQVDAAERARQIRVAASIGLVACLAFSVFNFLTPGMMALGLTELGAAALLLFPAVLLARQGRWVDWAETLVWSTVVVVFLALLHFGGVAGTGVFWVFTVPFLAFFLKGQRQGWWFSLGFAALIALYLLVLSPQLESAYRHSSEVVQQFLLSVGYYTLIAAAFNQLRSRFEQALQERVEQVTRAEVETRKALEQQEELAAMRSRFVAMTSHEFRTPLALIQSSAELLRNYGARMPAHETERVLDHVETSVQRMCQMLDRVLQLGRAEDQILHFSPRMQPLRALCQQWLDDVAPQLAASHCTLRTDLLAVPEQAYVDETLLRHIFSNLLSNAIKYSPQGGEVVLRGWGHSAQLRFEVRDQGIGIPPQELPRLFDGYHRASNVGNIAGTGLGLVIVRQAAQKHGGDVSVRSTPGRGSCFEVVISCAAAERDSGA